MEDFKRDRKNVKAKMTRLRNYVESFKGGDVNALVVRQNAIKDCLREFNEIQNKIEKALDSSDDEGVALQEIERETFETRYFDTLALINKSLNPPSFLANDLKFSTTFRQTQSVSIPLPPINLPKFSGRYADYMNFMDRFARTVDSNQTLSNADKLTYLKGCLEGEAADTIFSLSISDSNYDVALAILSKRYKNDRLIVQQHVENILSSPCLVKGSPDLLRKLINDISVNLAALGSLKVDVSSWDPLLVPIIQKKLDFHTKREWEMSVSTNVPKLSELMLFLEKRLTILQSLSKDEGYHNRKSFTKSNLGTVAQSKSNRERCLVCDSDTHNAAFKCPVFLRLNVRERLERTRQLKFCERCLLPSKHDISKCKYKTCKKCKGNHNILVHQEVESNPSTPEVDSVTEIPESFVNLGTTLCTKNLAIPNAMLSTALIYAFDNSGKKHKLRCLLDNGAQNCFITQDACKLLNLPQTATNFEVSGLNQGVTSISKAVKIRIFSQDSTFQANILCLVIDRITGILPEKPLALSGIPKNICLADPNYGTPGPVHLLLGADIFWEILRAGCIHLDGGFPTLQNTALGYIIGGRVKSKQIKGCNFFVQGKGSSGNTRSLVAITDIWQVDKMGAVKGLESEDSDLTEEHFKKTVKRDPQGRFIVSLPFKSCRPTLGSSRNMAEKRFLQLEGKLVKNRELYLNYRNVIQNHIDLGHLVEVPPSKIDGQEVFYLPHRAVVKDSKTSSTRVVYDASSKSSNNVSLNDVLHTGPPLQQNLFCVLMGFRTYQYALIADVTQMYLQICLEKNDWNFLRILWRHCREDTIKTYCLTRVTFGLSCSPFLAMRCIKELAIQNSTDFPKASAAILNHMYIDDLLTGSNTLEEAQTLRNDIISIFNQAKFNLHKWCSNNASLLDGLKSISSSSVVKLDRSKNQKTLGMIWNASEDYFKFEPRLIEPHNITKRAVSSILGQFYDPLGLMSAVTVTAKIILQKLWSSRLEWDDQAPINLVEDFKSFLRGLEKCNEIRIPRKVLPVYPFREAELHIFNDASERAYGSCAYIRILDSEGKYHSNLLCSKCKVAPLKSISIPKLELNAALLGARLADTILKNLNLNFNKVYFWSDSMVVLSWVIAPYFKWKTYVANRVRQIQELTLKESWYYVASKDNSADLVSRGVTTNNLLGARIWWNGPEFLEKDISHIPNFSSKNTPNNCLEFEAISLVVTKQDNYFNQDVFQRFSSFSKLKRVMAYMLRFINHTRKTKIPNSDILTVAELDTAEITILQKVQQQNFMKEINSLKGRSVVENNSAILALSPFLHSDGLLRVRGRVSNSNLAHDEKHPIILPSNCKVTKLIIQREHEIGLHAGVQGTLYSLRKRYWILKGRSSVKSVVQKCITCFRSNPVATQPIMGDLPRVRFETVKPFHSCGVDFGGPFPLRIGGPRSKKQTKAYLCLFICLTTKALHLEVTSDLTTKSFLNALKRFISRRGNVAHIYSDNAKTFVRANKDLEDLVKLFNENNFRDVLSTNFKITWHFIPPLAPNFGGIWERAVRSVKGHLKRVIGQTVLNFEELHTIFVMIENCLNSRPISPMSDDPKDLLPLTPNHFLFGDGPYSLAELDLTTTPQNRLSRYQFLQRLRQDLWKRWQAEYINNLQQRPKKSRVNTENIKEGDLVLLKGDGLLPGHWVTGRVCELCPGKDGVVRVVVVQTISGRYKRPTNKLCRLPMTD